jgi:hypothetical protein
VAEPARQAVPFLSDADHLKQWKRESWRGYTALQQPEYPDKVGRALALGMHRWMASGQLGFNLWESVVAEHCPCASNMVTTAQQGLQGACSAAVQQLGNCCPPPNDLVEELRR